MIELNVPAMSCGGCAKSIERVCAKVDPAAKVQVDLQGKKVRIESATGRERFAKALAEAGFPPS